MHQLLKMGRLVCGVSSIEIFRLKQGDDHVYLHTNLPCPKSPHIGGLALHITCDRGLGEEWAHINFPGVETHLYDHTLGRIRAHNPARLQAPLEEVHLAASVAVS